MLRLDNVHVAYGPVSAVRGLSLDVGVGEIVALVGANGAGKSSTLCAILGLAPSTGSVKLQGEEIGGMSTVERVSRGIALSPEGRHVFPQMSVLENLKLGLVKHDTIRTQELIDRVFGTFPRLRERSRQMAGTLSGGEQQMLAISRALMSEPRVFMLDEPTLGLAPMVVDQIAEVLRTLRASGMAILLSEQNAEMALSVADRAYVMETGKVSCEGPATVIAADPAVQAAYLGL